METTIGDYYVSKEKRLLIAPIWNGNKGSGDKDWESSTLLLIAPIWNGNDAQRDELSDKFFELLIAPIWNGNSQWDHIHRT